MCQLTKIVMERLEGKGLAPEEIHRFIRDVTNNIPPDNDFDLEAVNIRLHLLGWDPIELDDHTFQLIKARFEAEKKSKNFGEDRALFNY
jgi:hypothetical protein